MPKPEDDRASKILKNIEARLSKRESKFSDSNAKSLHCSDDRSKNEKSHVAEKPRHEVRGNAQKPPNHLKEKLQILI